MCHVSRITSQILYISILIEVIQVFGEGFDIGLLVFSILHTFIDAVIDPGPIAPNSKTLSMVWRLLSYWAASEKKQKKNGFGHAQLVWQMMKLGNN